MGEKNIIVAVHDSYRWVVAVCDEELRGRVLTEGIKNLDLSGNFFKGELMSDEEVEREIIRCAYEDATFNIVGERSVNLALKMGLISSEGVLKIDGVPFALSLL